MLNNYALVGRVVRDPELKELENGTKVLNTTIAVDRRYKDKDNNTITDFINLTLWDKAAENCSKLAHKGDTFSFEGRLANREISTDNDKKITTLEPVVERFSSISHSKSYYDDLNTEKDNKVEMEK